MFTNNHKSLIKSLIACMLIAVMALSFTGCAMIESDFKDLKGNLVGQEFTIDTFDNFGTLTMKTHGEKINILPNIVEEKTYSSEGGWGHVETLSSAITITIDGHQMTSCGDTCIFYEKGLEPEYDFTVSEINSESDGSFTSNTAIAGMVNAVKNAFGKPVVVVIKSQTGYPLYAFSGEEVYWEIPDDLPKCTLLNIDGKHLYIHRANYQIIDTARLD